MAKKEKRQLNLLDCTPLREPEWTWTENEKGLITLHKVHTSFTDRLIHTVTKKPLRQTHIDLEEFGTFLWKNMDGRKTLRELAELLHEEFGEKVEPLYPRLNQYVVTMKKNNLIFWHLPENRPEKR
ncbi:MAG: PqqD family protein [Firmicutes bacterium]|nr:PqqD family protein [Bacillota bacterium]